MVVNGALYEWSVVQEEPTYRRGADFSLIRTSKRYDGTRAILTAVEQWRNECPIAGAQFVLARGLEFSRANLRQMDWRRRGNPFAEASAPGGSRKGSTEMRS